MSSEKKTQTMKPATAAQKLGILLEAAPEEFQNSPISRTDLAELETNPPAWLVDLRRLAGDVRGLAGAFGVAVLDPDLLFADLVLGGALGDEPGRRLLQQGADLR